MSQLPSDVGKTLDRSWGFSRFLCQMKQEKEELEASARAVLELALPWARGMGRSWAGGGWSSIGVLRDWRMLGEGNPAKMVLFILQQKSDAWKNGIF